MKVSSLKKIQILLLFFALQFCAAQVIPQISYKDFGFEKKILKFEKITFKFKDKVALDKEKEIYIFNDAGDISKIVTESYGNEENFQATIAYSYKDGKLVQEVGTFPKDPQMNFTTSYVFDSKNNIISSKFDGDGYRESTKYTYKNNRLDETTIDNNGSPSSERYFYTSSGDLFKKTHIESFSGSVETTSFLYYNGKEIANYTGSYANPIIKYVSKKANLSYNIISKNGVLKLKELENKLKAGDKADLEVMPDQIQKWGKENLDLSFFMGDVFLYKDNEMVASAEVNQNSDDLEILTFYEITFPDESKVGSTDFNFFYYKELKSYLKDIKP